jgi:predicted ATPase
MIVRMGRARSTGPDSPADKPLDGPITGARPASLTAFVGRTRELDELRSLFQEGKRLVTLVGIGGIGKTRLAMELGAAASDLGWTKVYLVELASLTPDLVDTAVLESVSGESSRSPLPAAAEYLRDAAVLLVLDCCEHVLDAVRHVAEVLLRRCPAVAILATSRSPVEVAGELVWQVPPLSMQTRDGPAFH